jgi:CHASE3 domain sensor protein
MGELPVWHLRLYSIRRKILAFFAFLIFGVFLLAGVAITLSHRMHTYTVAIRSETQDLRRIDERSSVAERYNSFIQAVSV